ncbi:MAG: hypothetical protein ABL973_06395 [Micropepsaceae bacterium]
MSRGKCLLGAVVTFIACTALSPAVAQMISPSTQPASEPTSVTTLPSSANCDQAPSGQPNCPFAPGDEPLPAPSSMAAPSLAGGSAPMGSGGPALSDVKVLSYFQHGMMQIDTNRAFGFVLMPRSAITSGERAAQIQFCEIALATMDFMAPGTVATSDALATYWPIVSYADARDIEEAFSSRNCASLIAWYDHSLARSIASKAGLLGRSGPLLITWPSRNALVNNPRDPLIVDFANADYSHATKALGYWFRQASRNPRLWRSYIREGTLRAELADAINDTAGVMLAVLAGKWDSLAAVGGAP